MVLDGSLHYVQCVPYAAILQSFQLFSMICYYRIQRMPWPNNKMYDDANSSDRFRYQLTMFGIRILIGQSRLLLAHIAYDIDSAKIIAAFFRISYCLYDLIRLNSIIFHDQTTKCTMMRFSLIDSAINWLMFEVWILIGLSRLISAHIAYEIVTTKTISAFCRISYCLHYLIRLN